MATPRHVYQRHLDVRSRKPRSHAGSRKRRSRTSRSLSKNPTPPDIDGARRQPLLLGDSGAPLAELFWEIRRREVRRAYQRAWIAERRAAFFKGKACVECGSAESLELDHLDKASKVDHRIWSWASDRRLAEIAKCRVVCEGCHRERHAEERRKPLQHGTPNGYKKRCCRCTVCRAWNAGYKASLKAAAYQSERRAA